MHSSTHNTGTLIIRWGIFSTIYIALPITLYAFAPANWALPALWIATLASLPLLLLFKDRERVPISRTRGGNPIRVILLRAAILAFICAVTIFIYDRESFFVLPLYDRFRWYQLLIAYPIVSVIPQSILFRLLLFEGFGDLFPGARSRLIASAALFGLAHIVFRNPSVMLLCAIGGFFINHTYQRTRSVLMSAIEHTLYGYIIFTIGMAEYFSEGTLWLTTLIE